METVEAGESRDTLYRITAGQLRATVMIFAEHGFLKSENGLLKERVLLLERSGMEKDYIIRSQNGQIVTLGEIIDKKDAMLMNCDAMMENLRGQVAAEQKRRKRYMLAGAVVVAAVVGVAVK